jgi:hypothetical protein
LSGLKKKFCFVTFKIIHMRALFSLRERERERDDSQFCNSLSHLKAVQAKAFFCKTTPADASGQACSFLLICFRGNG